MKKKILAVSLCTLLALTTLVSCGSQKGDITVISREDGSGTRTAFTELVGIEDADGNDATVVTAEVTNSTAVMLQSVIDNKYAIGYVSIGALSSDVKTVMIDDVEPTAINVQNGSYKIARSFNVVTKKSGESELAKDFIKYILSEEGQSTVESQGFVNVEQGEAYVPSGLEGTLTISGSTSVAPVMEVLAENYMKLNSGVEIEIQQSGSSAGITAVTEGVCDIGMSSRELSSDETTDLTSTKIALDGIAIIVNDKNQITNMSMEMVKKIYTGEVTTWEEVEK